MSGKLDVARATAAATADDVVCVSFGHVDDPRGISYLGSGDCVLGHLKMVQTFLGGGRLIVGREWRTDKSEACQSSGISLYQQKWSECFGAERPQMSPPRCVGDKQQQQERPEEVGRCWKRRKKRII